MSMMYKLTLRFLAIGCACIQTIFALAQTSAPTNPVESLTSETSTLQYFPVGVFDSSNRSRSDLIASGLTKYLHAMAEPSMLDSSREPGAVSYRIIRRSYPSGKGVVLRLSIGNDGTAKLVTKVTSGEGMVILNKMDTITASEVKGFLEIIGRSDFWSLPTTEVEEPPLLKDGTTWALEGIRDGAYHIVYRRNPKPSRYTDVGRYFAKNLAKLDDSTFYIPEHPY